MELSLEPGSIAALFGAMAMLAALPSTSVLVVTAQAAAHGFRHGALVAAGVVAGDLVYILVAIFGLHLLTGALSGVAEAIRYLGGLYLLWFALRLWRSCPEAIDTAAAGITPSTRASFLTGLLITLGDQKAVLFYLGFLPAFVDLPEMSGGDVLIVSLVVVIAVGGIKLLYAALAGRARSVLGSRLGRAMNRLAAALMAAVGLFLLAGTFLSSSVSVRPPD
jgi:threonine/homoserine/homoserine lactone efflux protein